MLERNISLFNRMCWVSESLGSVLVHWDPGLKKLMPAPNFSTKAKKHKTKCNLYLLCISLFGFSSIYVEITKEKTHVVGWSDYMLFSVVVLTSFGCYFCLVSFRKNTIVACQFVNGLLDFTKHGSGCKSKLGLIATINHYATHVIYLSIIGIPIVMLYGLHLLNPCKPVIAGYWLLPECSVLIPEKKSESWYIVSWIGKVILLMANHLMLAFGLNFWCVAGCGLSILGSESLQHCIKM